MSVCQMTDCNVSNFQAEKTIRICTPYFIPPDPLTAALVIAAARGVKVELILPAKSDSFIVQHASFSFIKPVLQRGVKVYLYEKGFIHAKTISIDGSLAFVGTVNMDTRSFFLNFEITSIIYETVAQIEQLKAQGRRKKTTSVCGVLFEKSKQCGLEGN